MAIDNGEIIDRKPFDVQEAVILLDVYLYEKDCTRRKTCR